jgi:hypothetical protein
MAQKTIVELVDDLDGGKADESLAFSLDGMEYVIDLSEKNAAKLRDAGPVCWPRPAGWWPQAEGCWHSYCGEGWRRQGTEPSDSRVGTRSGQADL